MSETKFRFAYWYDLVPGDTVLIDDERATVMDIDIDGVNNRDANVIGENAEGERVTRRMDYTDVIEVEVWR